MSGQKRASRRRDVRALWDWWLEAAHGLRGLRRRVNGVEYRALPRYRWYFTEEFDAPVARVFRDRVRPGSTCLSVGANLGMYPLQVAAWSAPDGGVFAFEPNPAAARVLADHLRLNGVEGRVRIVAQAVGDRGGDARFFAAGVDGMSRLGVPNPLLAAAAEEIRVPVGTLDDFCRAERIRPDAVMIDVEGFEQSVLAGAAELLTGAAPPATVVEMHPSAWADFGTDRGRFEELLRALRLKPTPLSGQADPLGGYGHVLLERSES